MTRKGLAASVAFIAAVLLGTSAASAHPLGNFTTNRFSGIEIWTDRVTIHYVVDFAEIAALEEIAMLDENGDERADDQELASYAELMGRRLLQGVGLAIDGEIVTLATERTSAALRPGQGGLDTLRVEVEFGAPLASPETSIGYVDRNYTSLLGWKEIVAFASGGQGIVSSSVPATSISDELRAYPRERLQTPPQVNGARVVVAPGAAGTPPPARMDIDTGAGDPFAERFTSLVEGDLSPATIVVALALALVFGAAHALSPGHGKTVMAAFLVGTEGRARHAVAIGVAISAMHTASVLVLGIITLWASRLLRPERVYPWLSLLAGAIVLALGAWLLRTRIAARHEAGGHHEHSHAAPGVSPLSWQGLTALGTSGGLLPSPSALVVLLGAIALGRLVFGLALVGAFSIGLAVALALIGLLVIRARSFAQQHLGTRVSTILPVLSAGAIFVVGLFLTGRGAMNL